MSGPFRIVSLGRMSSAARLGEDVAISACADGLDVRVAESVIPTLCPIGSSVIGRVVKPGVVAGDEAR